MSKPLLISVIVPVYNAEKYLYKCVNSLLSQTYKNIEIILVDDGSTDSSGNVCDKFAENNKNIIVIHKKNGGTSSAKNMGIKRASGEYISFLDADDFMDSDTYECISNVIEKANPDCIDFGWKYINEQGDVSYNLNGVEKNIKFEKQWIHEYILPPLINLRNDPKYFVFDFSTTKIYKTEIIKKYNIYYDESRKTWEDKVFLVQYLKHSNSFYAIDKCFYNYVSVPNSLSRRYDRHFFNIILQNYFQYKEWFGNEYDFDTQYVNNHWCHSIENMIFRSLKEKEQKEEIRNTILKTLKNDQVITWYRKRISENDFEKRVSCLVTQGDVKKVITEYENVVKKQKKQEQWQRVKSILYRFRVRFR